MSKKKTPDDKILSCMNYSGHACIVEVRTRKQGMIYHDGNGFEIYTNEWRRVSEAMPNEKNTFLIPKERSTEIPPNCSALTYNTAMALAWSLKAMHGDKIMVRVVICDLKYEWKVTRNEQSETELVGEPPKE